jgi:protein-disulfide isomerase
MTEQEEASIKLVHMLVAAVALAGAGIAVQVLSSGGVTPAAGGASSSATVVRLTDGARVDLKLTADQRGRGAWPAQAQLVVYGDFASPFAATAGRVVDAVATRFSDSLYVAFRHAASADNETSMAAAIAAEAAANLGKFAAFREAVFGRNDGLGYVDFAAWSRPLGLDDKAFRAALESPETKAAVVAEIAQAKALGVNVTPTFFLNGVKMPGTLPVDALAALVEAELGRAEKAGGLDALLAQPPFDLEGVDIGTLAVKKEGEARFGKNEVRISDADPSWGNADAAVTIVEFGDFLCPYCARGAEALSQIKEKYGEAKVRVIFKNLPLRMHRYADVAARAVLAARKQGKFWAMHRKLYSRQKDVKEGGVDAILGLGLELGLDLETLMEDMSSVAVREKVADDSAEAERMGVRFTPNYFINGEHIGGALPVNNFIQIIDRHLKN